MAISSTIKNQLWARSQNSCAICGRALVQTSGGRNQTLGELCHIVAKENSGPRANPLMSDEEKDSYDNIIILCPNHHTLIDRDTVTYTVDKLKIIKYNHENCSKYELKKPHDLFIEEWDKLCNCREWEIFTGNFLFASGYKVSKSHYELINNFISFYRTRPNQYFEISSIDAAFESYAHVLCDFISIFNAYRTNDGEDTFSVEKFYKKYDYPESDNVFKKYDAITTDLCNLLAEMTKSVNLIVKRIEDNLIPDFSRIHGYVCVDNSGLTPSGHGEIIPLHYSGEEAAIDKPYQGLEALQQAIANKKRSYCFNLLG